MTRLRPLGLAAAAVLAVAALTAGCAGPGTEPDPTALPGPAQSSGQSSARPSGGSPSPSDPAPPSPSPSASPSVRPPEPGPTTEPGPTEQPAAPGDPDLSLVAGWTLEEKVGQVVMVGLPVKGPFQPTFDMIRDDHIGGVFLHGRTQAGRQPVKNLVDAAVDAAAQERQPLFVATDQEGGAVQVLRGQGFSDIPSAVEQAGLDPADLRARSRTWGQELAAAGVNLNLAPVMDLVPQASAQANPPIGVFGRNYGFTAESVVAHGNAFAMGQRDAGVQTSIKHFPGLGRVTANTDTTAGVTDTVTGPDAPSVDVFDAGIAAGSGLVMMSSAVYTRIDPDAPAVFSPRAVGLVRDLGFDGVIISDDLSAAVQVTGVPAGQRAVRAVDAGVDLVLASAKPSVAPAMVDALLAAAREDPAFAAKVDAAAARVVAAKAGL
ncbi:glycoside hydrolase family 3 N-terminal domain-containing protein [Promicromonospora thailandica]|uniref:Beta-N-acetylhexosaminidase n=1 Tax=Promicromonospora thailandica TaxID=765201 RepID=A0A9X2G8I6_9MICO|nr:glycoside hydrolase family 3 N-terminal domain-containing protein [Promicromonospora thailandica]MCP2265119.1 beta-N-acetylhexosaminidase [Promicromonospora thailandica]